MKLRTLLLGSAAAIFVSGAATTASAADATGLVVATMQNNAAYVPLCNGDDGFQLNGWCFVLTGEVEWTWRNGFQTTRTYGAVPNAPDGEIDEPTTIVREAPSNVIFNLTRELEIEVDNGYTEFVLNVIGGTLSLDIGNFAFTANGVTWSPSIGDIDFDIRLRESDTLGWRDALRGDIGNGTGDNANVRNWVPSTQIPDGEIAIDFGAIDFAFNAGARHLRTGALAPGILGPYSVTLAPGTANTITTIGGEFNFNFEIGDAITLTGGADFDRIMMPSALAFPPAGNAATPGDDTVTYELAWAYGANIGVEVELGPITAEVHGYYGRNFGGYTMYQYWYQPAGTYWAVEGNLGIEIGAAELTFEATLTDGPQIGLAGLGAVANPDRVLLVEAGLELAPENLDDVTINLGALLERQMYAGGFRRLSFTGGVEFEPADDVAVEVLLTHTRPVANWGAGTPAANGVPASTKVETTITIGF